MASWAETPHGSPRSFLSAAIIIIIIVIIIITIKREIAAASRVILYNTP